jgi:hypothetical protein
MLGIYYPENATFGDFIVVHKKSNRYFPENVNIPVLK